MDEMVDQVGIRNSPSVGTSDRRRIGGMGGRPCRTVGMDAWRRSDPEAPAAPPAEVVDDDKGGLYAGIRSAPEPRIVEWYDGASDTVRWSGEIQAARRGARARTEHGQPSFSSAEGMGQELCVTPSLGLCD